MMIIILQVRVSIRKANGKVKPEMDFYDPKPKTLSPMILDPKSYTLNPMILNPKSPRDSQDPHYLLHH